MPFASQKISISRRRRPCSGLLCLLIASPLTLGLLTTENPAESQEPVVIGSPQPQIQINEEAAYIQSHQPIAMVGRLPLFDPAKDTLRSRVIYLPPAISSTPNPQIGSEIDGGKAVAAPASVRTVAVNETEITHNPAPQSVPLEVPTESDLIEIRNESLTEQTQPNSSSMEPKDKELAAIPANQLDDLDQKEPNNTRNILTDTITIIFDDGAKDISAKESEKLAAFANELVSNDSARLQLRSYARDVNESASAARRLSLARALAVRSFLIEAGVNSTRIDVRALGAKSERGPADRVDLVVAN